MKYLVARELLHILPNRPLHHRPEFSPRSRKRDNNFTVLLTNQARRAAIRIFDGFSAWWPHRLPVLIFRPRELSQLKELSQFIRDLIIEHEPLPKRSSYSISGEVILWRGKSANCENT